MRSATLERKYRPSVPAFTVIRNVIVACMTSINNQDAEWWENFQRLLDDQTEWPTEYVFKFIAPESELERLKAVFGQYPTQIRASSKGNYYSVTAKMEVHSSDEVIALYKAAAEVEGVISL